MPPIERRTFLKFAAGAAATGPFIGYEVAAIVPPAVPETPRSIRHPGWLQTTLPDRPALIDPEGGHSSYLRKFCLEQPVVRTAFAGTVNCILDRKDPRQYKVGELFSESVGLARDAIKQQMRVADPHPQDSLLVAVLSFAGSLSTYFSTPELRDIGVHIPPHYQDRDKLFLMDEYYKSIPKLFPVKCGDNCTSPRDQLARYKGGDRSHHQANHIAVPFLYYYALKYGLQDADRIPIGIKPFLLGKSVIEQAKFLGQKAGEFWELLEGVRYAVGIRGEFDMDENGNRIKSGWPWDEYTDLDYLANKAGCDMAARFMRDGQVIPGKIIPPKDDITYDEIREITQEVDASGIYQEIDRPVGDNRLDRRQFIEIFTRPFRPSQLT